jgi:hypothetical protein
MNGVSQMSSSRRSLLGVFVVTAVAGSVAGGILPARASDLRMTVEKPQFICEKGGIALSHVTYHPGRKAHLRPALPCCDGQLGCAQFLSTSTVLHPPRHWHS